MLAKTTHSHAAQRAGQGRLALALAGAVSLVCLLAANSAVADVANGEILIGTPATGSDLDPSRLPERPLLVAIDSPYEVFSETGTLIHVAAWAPDGTPASHAEVYFENALVGLTDETGTLVFRWGVPADSDERSWSRGGTVSVRWQHNSALYGGEVGFSAHPRTNSFASDHVFVYTDRAIYNPGDAIRIRAIGWNLRTDYTPIEGEDIELLLSDPTGRVVAGGTARTDEFGVTSLDFQLSEHAEEGVYELTADYEGAEARARLRVRRFVPPVIRIEHTLGRFLTRDQLELAFDVSLGYFTEAQFVRGSVSLDLLVDGESRYHAQRDVEGAGPHAFSIDAESLDAVRRGLVEDDRVEVELVATDHHGRSDELLRELRFTANPYVAIIEKDRDYYRPGDPIELIVRLADRERVPVRHTEVALWTSAGDSLLATTDADGTVQFSLVMPDTELSVEVLLADVGAPVAAARIPLLGSDPMRSHIADAVVREDESAEIVVHFPAQFVPVEDVVHIDVTDYSGALVQSVLIPVSLRDGVYVAQGRFATPSWGSMLLTLFCLGRDSSDSGPVPPTYTGLGLLTEGQNLAVHPNRELHITLDGIPDHLAPGSEYGGQIRVTDPSGAPVDAVVGAAVVDAAIISLGSPLEITPMDYFYNPRLRVISTTGSAILTWPVVSRNWGARHHDVALPPFDWLANGEIHGRWREEVKTEALSLGGVGGEPDDEYEVDDWGLGFYADERPVAEVAEPAAVVTIRTEFPETSLWEPRIDVRGGRGAISGVMPDAITTQEIALVASDQQGGVGVLRVPVRITQPLYVQADLPERLTVGDRLDARVVVQNLTDRDLSVDVGLESEGLHISGGNTRLEVPAQGQAMATIPVRADRPGALRYTARASAAGWEDLEQRQIWVLPSGTPTVAISEHTLTAAAPAELSVAIPSDGQMSTLALNLAFPAVGSAFAGLDAIRTELAGADTMSLGGELIASALLYRFQKAQGGDSAALEVRRAQLNQTLVSILASQRPDGGWGFWWDFESNPYITGYCLEALTALEDLELTVPTSAYRRAVNYLSDTLAEDGLYDMAAIAFWEGNTEAVRRALTAEIFSIMAGVPSRARTPDWREALEVLAPIYEAYLFDLDSALDPLTYAHAALGLHRASEASVIEIDPADLQWAAGRLAVLRSESHWEPSWFNAYGGTIEATVTALQLYSELGREGLLASEEREAVRYLLSTRDEWGGWHNPRGTAAAIRGLLLLQPGAAEVPSTVVVAVDGREVARVAIDPEDPFLSAVALRDLDLTEFVRPGVEHMVTVSYDGALEPDLRLVTRHWGEPSTAPGSALSLSTSLSGTRAAVDAVLSYSLHLESRAAAGQLVHLDLAAPANAEIDAQSLDSLKQRGLIDGFEARAEGYRLTVALEGRGRRELDVRLTARRPGEAVVPAATVHSATASSSEPLAVAMIERPLSVE